MIVIGVDVHKHSLTAVAVDEVGRPLAERSCAIDDGVIPGAQALDGERLWALEDCRHLTRRLEQALLSAGEKLVRLPPRLTGPHRRRSRSRGKSDGIDAAAVARAALQEPQLDGPRPGEETLRCGSAASHARPWSSTASTTPCPLRHLQRSPMRSDKASSLSFPGSSHYGFLEGPETAAAAAETFLAAHAS